MPDPRSAVVIGGGVAGLVWALDASEAGLDVTLVEGSASFGGVVRTARLGPVDVDVGAESFALTRPDVLDLAARLGMTDEVAHPSARQAHVSVGGRLIPLPPGLLGIPATADDIAAVLGADTAEQAAVRDARPVATQAPATIGALVRERLGDAVADTLVDPVLAGVHATHADDAELASVAPSLHAAMLRDGGLMPAVRTLRGALGPAGSPVATFEGGMGRLVERLASILVERGVRLRPGTPAIALAGGDATDRWDVDLGIERLTADVVCLAVPAHAAAGLLRSTGSAHPAGIAALLAALPTTDDVTLVTLLVEDAALTRAGAPVGSGVLVADGTVGAKAMTHASAKWGWLAARLPPDHHVLRLSYGGTHATEDGEDGALVDAARRDALRLLDGAADTLAIRASLVTRWAGALSRPVVGRSATLEAIDERLAAVPGLALTGSAVAGNGLAGVVGRSVREVARTLR
jgi:protoporphyrinogen/coproporphyrinogen III oxidase